MGAASYVKALLMVIFALVVVAVVWGALCGCEHDGCEPEAMRCRDNAVEQCNADADWYTVEHCDGIEPAELDWVCCAAGGDLLACLPVEECEDQP